MTARPDSRATCSPLDSVIYVTFQELGHPRLAPQHRQGHRRPIADQLLARISADENLHMIFYRNVTAAFDINPDETMQAVGQRGHGLLHAGANMANLPAELDDHREGRHLRPPPAR